MLTGVLVTLGILGGIAVLVVLFMQRGREGLDLSLRGLVRVYLYLASLAGVIVFTIGISGILAFALAAAFGRDAIYGGPVPGPVPLIAPACPPAATGNDPFGKPCAPAPVPNRPPIPDERERRQQEDLVRGITFIAFGAIFWGAHWTARRGPVGGADERTSVTYRAYLMLGTAIFGITTITLLPTGVYQALSEALVTAPGSFRQGAGESLSGGLAALPLWLAYLWLVQRALRAPAASPAA